MNEKGDLCFCSEKNYSGPKKYELERQSLKYRIIIKE